MLASIGTGLTGGNNAAASNVISATSFRGNGAVKQIDYGNGRRLQMTYNNER